MLKSLNAKEAADLIKSNNDIKILDVRSEMEINMTGTIEGSILIDLNDPKAENLVNSLDKSGKYLLYCATGARAEALAHYMHKKGFEEIYNLIYGGYSQLAMALKNN
ncbi:rhodanese-like domain-containing protein [Brachyspira hampsonii]|uniref:Rhodanese-like protein n=1 Tax=Brachyspira hampsonii 30446 TaxID=1289135 RepID=A0A2U4EZY0_9SPIR|nr:rhodanese-like domain-containing protein [Brachyspira hampsonii]EKV57352.1 rhodanese-like protein [Brachyspira hampsonii 30446]MBW5389144.1 rhodanese-like domain-containing protein [Brachyspira hampsonii]MBW5393861.1 rhodanese-like domain-containing protein [Brachyspira hampsonii]OEJ19025.1 sulfurtransferase [Brachyspira hampsonii]PTY39445.1 sulfurtransferase [Brachyspira hampsonii bv. II]